MSSAKGIAFCVKRSRVVRPSTSKSVEKVVAKQASSVAEAIRDARKAAGLTQEKAAALRGHATSTISRWETGGLPQTWEELSHYAFALNQPIVLRFGPGAETEPPEPEWVERLLIGVMALEKRSDISGEELEAAEAEAIAYLAAAQQRRLRRGGGGGGAASNA